VPVELFPILHKALPMTKYFFTALLGFILAYSQPISCHAANNKAPASARKAPASAKKTPAPANASMQVHIVRNVQAQGDCEPNCSEWISAQGVIDGSTPGRFKKVLRQLGPRKLPVFIHSTGGSVPDSYIIGRLLRARGLDVAVMRTTVILCSPGDAGCHKKESKGVIHGSPDVFAYCASSCAFVLAAGQRRFVSPWAKVGVHQVKSFRTYVKVLRTYKVKERFGVQLSKTLVSEKKVSQKTVETNTPQKSYEQIQKYFSEMGVNKDIMPMILKTPNTTMHWLTPAELTLTRLATDKKDGYQLLHAAGPPSASPSPHDIPVAQGANGSQPPAPTPTSTPAKPEEDAQRATQSGHP
jgi:hypothetical protein